MAFDGSGTQTPTARKQYLERWGALQTERSSWLSHWQEISEYLLPRSGRFFLSDRNRGGKRNDKIYDSTGTRALRIESAGMMAGMTNPALPWVVLETADKDLMEVEAVKEWLDVVTKMMRDVFARSNFYRGLHRIYEELVAFGTAASILSPNFENVIHCDTFTAGEFAISSGKEGRVDTLYREVEMTVAAMVAEFGYDKCSQYVRNIYDRNRGYNAWVPIMHAIEPRVERDSKKRDSKNMMFKSCYFESSNSEDKLLRESGYRRFPALTPRWQTSGGDIYGNSPGMEALGDIKQLQHQQLRKSQAIDYMVRPPLQMPVSLKEQPLATMPGGVSYVDAVGPDKAIRSMFDVQLNLSHMLPDIQDIRQRINAVFNVDAFLLMQQLDQSGRAGFPTAREVAERHEEKLMVLGPVVEQLHDELLVPAVDITFDRIVESGMLPPPPKELQGMDLNIKFVSMMAQAQRAVGIGSVDRLVGTVLGLAQLQGMTGQAPTVIDKLNADQIVDKVSNMLGADPDLIVTDDKVAIVRKGRADAQAAQQKMMMVQQGAQTAKDLAGADTSGQNALTDLLGK